MSAPLETAEISPGTGARWWIVGAIALAIALLGLVAWAGNDDPGDIATAEPAVATPAPTTASAPPSTTQPPAVAEPAPVSAETTIIPTTTAPTAPPELVPGFPDTDDIEQFIEQLRDGRDVAGKQAKKLADKMRDIVREDHDGDRIEKLVEEIDRWVEKDELDVVVARRAVELIESTEDLD